MVPRIRETVVTLIGALLLAGPVAAVVVPALPPAWRHQTVTWAILLAALAVVWGIRRHRPPSS